MNAEQKRLEEIEATLADCRELQEDDCDWLISKLKAAQDENERLRNQWKPIDSVPRDCKVPLILWSPESGLCLNYRFMMATEKYTWFESNGKAHRDMPHLIQDATHWQPLPQPPTK